jgi:hypothetical protein
MPKAKEFTVTIADKPGALGKCLLALAERGVNILALPLFSTADSGPQFQLHVAKDTPPKMAGGSHSEPWHRCPDLLPVNRRLLDSPSRVDG